MKIKDILKKPLVTEKASQEAAFGRYFFEVAPQATKPEIARAVETTFGVKVKKVRTTAIRGKTKKSGRYRRTVKQADGKKATVELFEGEKIDLLETGE
jgi:large subunit ribosomal protein L23